MIGIFFEVIDTPEKAYWLGFIYADGWVCRSKVNGELGIQLARKDKEHLHNFCGALGIESLDVVKDVMTKRYIMKTGQVIEPHPSSKLRLFSMELVDDLIKEGCVLRKTYSNVSPDFKYSNELNIAMLRGYFDGDGCLDKNGFIHFTAFADTFLSKVKLFLSSLNIETYRIYYENESKARLMIKEKDHEKFLDAIYQNSSYTYLERKFKLYHLLYKTN